MKRCHKLTMYNLLLFILLIGISCSGIRSRYHQVVAGERWEGIASYYEVPLSALKEKNQSEARQGLRAGHKLYIPFEQSPKWEVRYTPAKTPTVGREALSYSLQTAHFTWPLSGRITSIFEDRQRSGHKGIDIAARLGTPVKAARSGHVIYASDGIGGYGNLIILRHSDKFATVYGHLSRFTVRKGQFVSRGGVIGRVGKTGSATGPHLHFEIRNDRRPVNPLLYLQGQYLLSSSRVP